jgi:hypothetical protein
LQTRTPVSTHPAISPKSDIAILSLRQALVGSKPGVASTCSRTFASADWTTGANLHRARLGCIPLRIFTISGAPILTRGRFSG